PFHILQQRLLDRLGIGPRQGVALLAPASLSLGVTRTHVAMLTPLRNGVHGTECPVPARAEAVAGRIDRPASAFSRRGGYASLAWHDIRALRLPQCFPKQEPGKRT